MNDRGQTPEAVALDLLSLIRGVDKTFQTKDQILALYKECLEAVSSLPMDEAWLDKLADEA